MKEDVYFIEETHYDCGKAKQIVYYKVVGLEYYELCNVGTWAECGLFEEFTWIDSDHNPDRYTWSNRFMSKREAFMLCL